jgi:hypothetical protein
MFGQRSIEMLVRTKTLRCRGVPVYIDPRTPRSLLRPVPCYRFQPQVVYLGSGMLPDKIGARQLRGPRLQYHISSGIGGIVEVSVHEFHAYTGSRCSHLCKDSSNSCPLCPYCLVIITSGNYLFLTISSLLLLLRHLLFFAGRSAGRGFCFGFLSTAATPRLQVPRLFYYIPLPWIFCV